MRISSNLVRKYQQAHEQKFGQHLSAKEAEQNLSNLANLIRLMLHGRSMRYGK